MSLPRPPALALLASLFLSAIGLALSIYLSLVHVEVAVGGNSGWCNVSVYLSCDAAASSSFSEIAGVPIAVLGAAFYAATFLLGVGALARFKRGDARGEPVMAVLGLLYSLAFAYSLVLLGISVTELGHLCPACAGTYVVNGLAFAILTVGFGGGPVAMAATVLRWGRSLATDVVGLLAAVLFVLGTAAGAIASRSAITRSTPAGNAAATVSAEAVRVTHAPSLGPADAAVVLVVFSDFQCPYCARFANILQRLHQAYPQDLRVEFRHFPLEFHRFAAVAARAAICAHAEGKFWELHDLVFAHQEKLAGDTLTEMIYDAGLSPPKILACADTPEVRGILAQDIAAGEAINIQGTPSFVLNGELINGFVAFEQLNGMVRAALQSVERADLNP